MSEKQEANRKMSGSRVDMKIVLLGKEYGGKTSLVERYLHNRWSGDTPYQNTIGAAFGAKRVEVDGQALVLGIWDTAGSERYEAMSRIYYRGAKAAVVCFDLTDRTSFDRARFWIDELLKNEEKCKIYLAGTKKDLVGRVGNKNDRAVDYHTTTDFADEVKAQLFETSSKTGENIGELFSKIANDFVKDPENKIGKAPEDDSFRLDDASPKRKMLKCC